VRVGLRQVVSRGMDVSSAQSRRSRRFSSVFTRTRYQPLRLADALLHTIRDTVWHA